MPQPNHVLAVISQPHEPSNMRVINHHKTIICYQTVNYHCQWLLPALKKQSPPLWVQGHHSPSLIAARWQLTFTNEKLSSPVIQQHPIVGTPKMYEASAKPSNIFIELMRQCQHIVLRVCLVIMNHLSKAISNPVIQK